MTLISFNANLFLNELADFYKKIIYNRYPVGNKRFNWKQKEYTLSTFSYLGTPDKEGDRLLEIVDRTAENFVFIR